MNELVVVHGTWGLDRGWWRAESLLMQAAVRAGCVLPDPADPYLWSGELGVRDHGPWTSAAHALIWYCAAKQLERPNLLTHSHGIQVAAYAAAWGQKFGLVVDVSGPPRFDMEAVYAAAKANIAHWMHVWNEGDMVILEGQVGAGRPEGYIRTMAAADQNVEIPRGFGHSGLLDDVTAMAPYLSQLARATILA